jgi:hypothetical protein
VQLNGAAKLEVLPSSATSFFLLGLGGWDFSFRFARDPAARVEALSMEGGGLSIAATRVE